MTSGNESGQRKNLAPEWLNSFEKLALMTVDGDANIRGNGDRLVKKWMKEQKDPLPKLLMILEHTENVYVVVVTVTLMYNLTLKLWTHTQEEKVFREQVDYSKDTQNNNSLPLALTSLADDSQKKWHDSISLQMVNFTQRLIELVLFRWTDDTPDSKTSRNQVFFLITQFIKKGWCETANNNGEGFCTIVRSLLSEVISVLDSFSLREACNFSCKRFTSMRLLVEIFRGIHQDDIARIGITWQDHITCKKSFEREVLIHLIPKVLSCISRCLLIHVESFSRGSDCFEKNFVHAELSSFLLVLCDFLEIFLEWDFLYTACEGLSSDNMRFTPTEECYSVVFHIQVNQNSTSLFQLVVEFYCYIRNFLFMFPKFSHLWMSVFEKVQFCLKRLSQVKLSRLQQRILLLLLPLPSSSLTKNVSSRLTQTVYSPFFLSLIDLLPSSQFIQSVFSDPSTTGLVWNVALRELKTISFCLEQLVENSEVDLLLLFGSEENSLRIDVLDKCFHSVLIFLNREDDAYLFTEFIVQSLEQFLCFYSCICLHYVSDPLVKTHGDMCSTSGNSSQLPLWVPYFFTSAFHITQTIFSSSFKVFDIYGECQEQETENVEEVKCSFLPYEFSAISSRYANESLRQLVVLGHCQPVNVCCLLNETLKKHLSCTVHSHLSASSSSPSSSFSNNTQTRRNARKELLYTLGYLYYFLIKPELPNNSSQRKPSIPYSFLLGDSDICVQITDLFTYFLQALVQAISSLPDASLCDEIPWEASFNVLLRFIETYFFNPALLLDGKTAFVQFNQLDFLQNAYQGILICVIGVLQKIPNHTGVVLSCFQCLLSLAEPFSSKTLVLWEIVFFQQLVHDTIQHISDPQTRTFSQPLKPAYIVALFTAFANTSSLPQSEQLIKSFYGDSPAHQPLEALGKNRLEYLLAKCQPIRDRAASYVVECQRSNPNICSNLNNVNGILVNSSIHSTQLEELNCIVSMCTGLAEGLAAPSALFILWIQSFSDMIETITETPLNNCDLCYSVVKYLFAVEKHYMTYQSSVDLIRRFYQMLDHTTQYLLRVGHSYLKYTSDCQDESESSDLHVRKQGEEFISSLTTVLELLTHTFMDSIQLFFSSSEQSSESQIVSSNTACLETSGWNGITWSCHSISDMLNTLGPLSEYTFVCQHNEFWLACCHLVTSLFVHSSIIVINGLTPSSTRFYCKIMTESLFSQKFKCQEAAAETIGACLHALILYQRERDMVNFSLEAPTQAVDLLADCEESVDVFFIFYHHAALMALRLLLATMVLPRSKEKKIQFYGDIMCHMLTFLSTKLYYLKRVFDQLYQLSFYNHLRQEGLAEIFLSKLLSPLLQLFHNYSRKAYEAVQAHQSISLQKIHYNQFRNEFQQHFRVFILAHRLDQSAEI